MCKEMHRVGQYFSIQRTVVREKGIGNREQGIWRDVDGGKRSLR